MIFHFESDMTVLNQVGIIELKYTIQVNQGTSVRQINDILLSMKRFPFVINAALQIGDEIEKEESNLEKKPTAVTMHTANNDINYVRREFAGE